MSPTGGVLRLALVLLVLAGGLGCSEDDDPVRVLVVGDSVTRLSTSAIERRLGWADTVDVRAHDGHRTDQLVGAARSGVDHEPDIAVVATGYNDILQGTVGSAPLGELVDAFDGVPCSVWVLLPQDGGYSAERAERWNQRVSDAVDGETTMHVTREWKALVERSPDFTFLSDFDAVHPNEQGREALAEVMDRAATRDCR